MSSLENISKAEKLALAKQKMKKFKVKKTKGQTASTENLPSLSSSLQGSMSDDRIASGRVSKTSLANASTGSIEVLPEKGPAPPIPERARGDRTASQADPPGTSDKPPAPHTGEAPPQAPDPDASQKIVDLERLVARLNDALAAKASELAQHRADLDRATQHATDTRAMLAAAQAKALDDVAALRADLDRRDAEKANADATRQKLEQDLLAHKAAFDQQLLDVLAAKEKDHARHQQQNNTLQQETEKALADMRALQMARDDDVREKKVLEAQVQEKGLLLGEKSEELAAIQSSLQHVQEAKAALERQVQVLQQERSAASDALAQCTQECNQTKQAQLDVQQQCLALEEKVAGLVKELAESRREAGPRIETGQSLEQHDLEEALRHVRGEKDRAEEKLTLLQAQFKKLVQTIADLKAIHDEKDGEIRKLQADLINAQDEKNEALAKLDSKAPGNHRQQDLLEQQERLTKQLATSEREKKRLEEQVEALNNHKNKLLDDHQDKVAQLQRELGRLQATAVPQQAVASVSSKSQEDMINGLTLEREQTAVHMAALNEKIERQQEKIQALLAITASRSAHGSRISMSPHSVRSSRISMSPSLEFGALDPGSPQGSLLKELEKTRRIFERLKREKEVLEAQYATLVQESNVLSEHIHKTSRLASRIEGQLDGGTRNTMGGSPSLATSVMGADGHQAIQGNLAQAAQAGAQTLDRLLRINARLCRETPPPPAAAPQPYLIYPLTPSKSSDWTPQLLAEVDAMVPRDPLPKTTSTVITGVPEAPATTPPSAPPTTAPPTAPPPTMSKPPSSLFFSADVAAIIEQFHQEQRRAQAFVASLGSFKRTK